MQALHEAARGQKPCLEETAQILQKRFTCGHETWRNIFERDTLANRDYLECVGDFGTIITSITQDKPIVTVDLETYFQSAPEGSGLSELIINGDDWETATLKVGQTTLSQIHRLYSDRFDMLKKFALPGFSAVLELTGKVGSVAHLQFSIVKTTRSPNIFRATFPCTKVLQVGPENQIYTRDLPTHRLKVIAPSGVLGPLELVVYDDHEHIGNIRLQHLCGSYEIIFQPDPILASANFFLAAKDGQPLPKDLVVIQEMFNVLVVVNGNAHETLYDMN